MLKTDHYTKLALFSLLVGHILAAYFSFGYHHPDEHFQILEWANYFIGNTPDASHLPWEFGAQIRPWFQPLCHAFLLKTFSMIGINPFDMAFFFRLIYAALNIWSIVALWNYFEKKYELNSKWFLILSLLWFFPYAHVRTSSENLAGIFLSFGLLILLKNFSSARHFFIAGLLFGFAFLSRFQIALGLVGLSLALLNMDHGFRKKHGLMIAGFLLPVGLGALFDRLGYGNWVFTPYQYFKVNILDQVAAQYNPYPWYQYLLWIGQLNPLISLPLFYGVIRYSLKNKQDILTAFVMSFFILHCFITNKEYRFLLPILNIVPIYGDCLFSRRTST
jgi:phosphatidylinositol glycan class B